MAFIHIRGKRDPISVSNERARTVKKLRFGESNNFGTITGKADPRDEIDLGEWCGEIGQIRSIEFEQEYKQNIQSNQSDIEAEKEHDRWIKMSPEAKAQQFGYFLICWSSRHGFRKVDAPRTILDKVYKIQLDYFRANPTATAVPSENFNSILPPKL